MAATDAMIAELRRMVAEPTEVTYNDAALADSIERYPLLDALGTEPYYYDTSTDPPTQVATVGWYPAYDLHAAAGDIWEEKAAEAAACMDYTVEGTTYLKSGVYDRLMNQARYHRARRTAKTARLHKSPNESSLTTAAWIGNLAEED